MRKSGGSLPGIYTNKANLILPSSTFLIQLTFIAFNPVCVVFAKIT